MKWPIFFAFVLLVVPVPAVHAEPWLCTEADGSRAFSYEPESAGKKNCVHRPIASTNVWRARPRDVSDARPEGFPRVDASLQKQRDLARREILARELAEERQALADATRALAEQRNVRAAGKAPESEARLKPYRDRVRLHATNVSNLEKELGREG